MLREKSVEKMMIVSSALKIALTVIFGEI